MQLFNQGCYSPPKSKFRNLNFNTNSHTSQKYNIAKDLAQSPCAMSALEALQHFPSQRRTLLETIGAVYPESYNNITFNLDNFKLCFSH
jgi:hypothetical protein